MKKRPVKILVTLASCLVVAACGALPTFSVLDGAVVVGTDKTMADHAISAASGKDCSLVRVERGRTYCKEDEVFPRPEVYCYRELGAVTCYDKPDLRRGDRGRLGDNEHNLVKKD